MKSTKHTHQHFLIWSFIIGLLLLIIILFVIVSFEVDIRYNKCIITSDALISIMATFIGICSAIMLGAQIYFVHHRLQIEKEFDNRTNEINKKLLELEELNLVVNDALASSHYNANSFLEGILDVIKNVVYMSNNTQNSDDRYTSKIGYAVYSIAKNIKNYQNDILVKRNDSDRIKEIISDWSHYYALIDRTALHDDFVREKFRHLDEIMIYPMKEKGKDFKFTVDEKNMNILYSYAKD